jgi:hypothetical protein
LAAVDAPALTGGTKTIAVPNINAIINVFFIAFLLCFSKICMTRRGEMPDVKTIRLPDSNVSS